jgi:hypothetical protein
MTNQKLQMITKIVLFADDTSIIITSHNPINFKTNINKIFQDVNRRFNANLSLNIDNTCYMQFVTKNSSLIDLNITHGNKKIANMCNITLE